MHRYRSHTCGELRASDVGADVRLSGWLHNRRDLGGILFIDLRDHYGITQLVARPGTAAADALDKLSKETVIRVDGKVVSRGAVQIKLDWKRRWSPEIGRPPQDLRHVIYGIGYDERRVGNHHFQAEIGVAAHNPQAALAHFPEFGSLKNAPHPGGLPALLAEEPRFVQAVADVAVELLEGR